MPEYISEITEEQKAQFPHQVAKWTRIGLSTERFNFEAAQEAILECYTGANLTRPKKMIVGRSPLALVYACPMIDGLNELPKDAGSEGAATFWEGYDVTDLRAALQKGHDLFNKRQKASEVFKMVRDCMWSDIPTGRRKDYRWRSVKDDIEKFATPSDLKEVIATRQNWSSQSFFNLSFGQFGAAYVAYVDTFEKVLGWEHECLKAHKWNRILTETCGFCWVGEDVVGISDRPIRINRDQMQQLHNDVDYAIEYSDGFGLCSWHGYTIPRNKEWIIREKDAINADKIEAEENAELRRIMLEKYGFDRYIAERDAKVVSTDTDARGLERRLLTFRLKGEEVRVLEVQNGTIEPDGSRRKFMLGAVRNPSNRDLPKTPREAAAWSYGLPAKFYDDQVRT